jgi:phosphoribosylformylglycinamidine synthase subunit PurL
MVRTNTLAGPEASDAAVVRIKETKRALALATDGNGRWCQLNPKMGAMHAVAEAARNVATSGARPIAATNCLNFGSPEKPEVMWQFSQAIDGLGEACIALGTPITGGNVSFYNETLGKSIYPTPVIGILGILEDAEKVLKVAFRNQGDVIVLLDGSNASNTAKVENRREFSSSEYSKTVGAIVAGEPPAIDLGAEKSVIECLVNLAAEGILQSAHDVSDGGIAVTLAESCFAAQNIGANVTLPEDAATEYALFGERGARVVVSVAREKLAAVQNTARQYGLGAEEIGEVTGDNTLRIQYKGHVAISAQVPSLKDVWANSLERRLKV